MSFFGKNKKNKDQLANLKKALADKKRRDAADEVARQRAKKAQRKRNQGK